MPYGDKILDHYNNPRNVGTLPKEEVSVGTGTVGAPECFGPNTIIAVADGRVGVPIENLFSENTTVMVWAFNIQEKLFEIKMARVVFTGDKSIDSVTFDDGGTIEVTPDHEFLQRPNYEYVKNCVLQGSILPFRKIISERGYWFIKNSKYGEEYKSIYHFSNSTRCGSNIHHKDGNKQNDSIENLEELSAAEHRIVSRRSGGIRPCYTLQVEELNNFVVLTSCSKNIRSGVVVKNCGDVMRLQVRVKDDVIVEAKFKTFGCGSAIASSSLATEWLKGKTVDEALTIKNTDIVTELNLPPQKIHCSVLTEDAIKAALSDYQKKQR